MIRTFFRTIAPLAPLATLLVLVACGSSESVPRGFDPTKLPEGTAVEPWGIGDSWYDYGFVGHFVTPAERSWVITNDDGAYHLVVNNYYGPTGEGATPKVDIRTWTNDAWSPPVEWQAPRSLLGKPPLCLRLADAQTVECADAYDIIWRINRRPVPEQGFSVSNPGIFVNRGPGIGVFQFEEKTPPATVPTEPSATAKRIRSIFDSDAQPILPFDELQTGGSIFMLTARLKIAEWSVVKTSDGTVVVKARCVDAKPTHAATDALDVPPGELRIEGERQQWSFVELCGDDGAPELATSLDAMKVGQWPDNTTFGLVIQTIDGQIKVWVSPDQPIEVRTDSPAFENTVPPATLWSLP